MNAKRKNIAIISVTQGEGHGAETVLEELLRGWNDNSLSLTVIAPEGSRVLSVAKEVDVRAVALKTSSDALVSNMRAAKRVRQALRGCDLLHAWGARSFEVSWWTANRLGVPACGTLHDHPRAEFHGKIRRQIMAFSANRFHNLVCVSHAVAEACRQSRYRGPLTVVRNGLRDISITRVDSAKPRIGFLGMYAAWKGFDFVKDWVNRSENTDLEWHLYGEPASALRPAAETLQRQFPKNVFLEGNMKTESIFEGIDILLHCSPHFDPLPTVLIEAARAGIPAVASSAGGAPEIVLDGNTGFIFDPRDSGSGFDKLQSLSADAELRRRMGLNARKHYEQNFRVDLMVSGYRDFWRGMPDPTPDTRKVYL